MARTSVTSRIALPASTSQIMFLPRSHFPVFLKKWSGGAGNTNLSCKAEKSSGHINHFLVWDWGPWALDFGFWILDVADICLLDFGFRHFGF